MSAAAVAEPTKVRKKEGCGCGTNRNKVSEQGSSKCETFGNADTEQLMFAMRIRIPCSKCGYGYGYGSHVRKMSSEGYPDADADAVPKPCEVRN